MKLVAGIWGIVVYSLNAPMMFGLIVHAISLIFGRGKPDGQPPVAPPRTRLSSDVK